MIRYCYFLILLMSISPLVSFGQTINLLQNNSGGTFCAGSVMNVSFATSGTFAAGNTFRVQLSANYGGTYIDLPGSFTGSPASVTLPASSNPTASYVVRVLADKPLIFSSYSYTFRIVMRPTAQLTGSTARNTPVNPFPNLNLSMVLTGGSSYTITLQDSTRYTKYEDYSNSSDFPISPAQTTTYTLASVRNACGTGPVSGSATVLINPIGFQLLTRSNESLCLGARVPVYYSTAAPLPPNTTFEAELISTNDANRSIALPVSGTASPLQITLPSQYFTSSVYGYQLRVFSKTAGISAFYRDGNTFSLDSSPRLSLTTPTQGIPLGGQASLLLSYTATATGDVFLSDGQQINLSGSGSFGSSISTVASPAATTSYSIVSYSGACSEGVSYDNRSTTVRVRPGIRVDSLSVSEVCAGQPVTIYYTATPGYTLPGRMLVKFGYSFSAEVTAVRPGQLTFTPPTSTSPLVGQAIQLRDALRDTLLVQASQTITIKTVPDFSFRQLTQTATNPGERYLDVSFQGGGTTQVLFNTGDRLTLTGGYYQGYYNQISVPVYVPRTTTFATVSVSNECGVGRNANTTTVTVQNTPAPVTGIVIKNAEVSQANACPGSRQLLNVYPSGTFNADNQFQLEVSGPNGSFSGSPIQSFTKAEAISFTLPTLPGSYRVRVSSTSPVTRSNEQSYYINSLPTASVFVSLPTGSGGTTGSFTTVSGQLLNVAYNLSGGRAPYQYELLSGAKGRADYTVQTTVQATANTSFGIVRVTDACGTATTITTAPVSVVVVPMLLRTGSLNSLQACVQTPLLVPFAQLGSVPASASYVVQFSEDFSAWQTAPTSGLASPLTVTVPASLANRQVYYRVAYLDNGVLVAGTPFDGRLQIKSAPAVLLTTPSNATTVQIDRTNSSSAAIKLVDLGSDATVILTNGSTVLRVGTSANGTMQYVSQPGTYSIASAYNICGYGPGTGVVRVTERPYLSLIRASRSSACVGQTVSFSYTAAGDYDAGNKLLVYLADSFGSLQNRLLLTETTALNGVVSFSLNPSLKPSSYNVQIEASAPATNLYGFNLNVEAPVMATLRTASAAFYEGDLLGIDINSNTTGPFTVTLATPTGLTAISSTYSSLYVPIRATQSGSYTLLSAANNCGVGKASGVFSMTTIPPALVTIRPGTYYSVLCTNKRYTLLLNNTGIFDPANTFTVYLADSTGGNFRALPTINGPSQLTVTIPDDTPVSGQYSLRIGSSNPQHLGASSVFSTAVRQSPTGTLTGNTTIFKGDSTRISVALTGTPPWQFMLTDFFGPRTFTTSTSPYTLTVKPDTTIGYRLTEVRDNQCGVGTATGTALITVSRLLATKPALPLQVRPWPNPTTGWLHIEGDLPGRADVAFSLYTLSGTLVHQSVGSVRQGALQHRIDLSSRPAGVYILSAEQDGRLSQYKVLKE